MKKTIYLHIGHPKTASTSLQKFLADNKNILNSLGYFYPLFSQDMINHKFLSLWLNHDASKALGCQHDRVLQKLTLTSKIFLHWLKHCTSEKIILSAETFIGNADKLVDLLLKDHQVIVIAYFRRMDHYVESYYGEAVRNGSEGNSIEKHIKAMLPVHMSRYSMVTLLAEKLGVENVIVRPFESGQLKNQCVVDDFLSVIGLHDISMFVKQYRHFNDSLPIKYIRFIQELNNAFLAKGHIVLSEKVAFKLRSVMAKTEKMKTGFLLSYQQRIGLIESTRDLDGYIARVFLGRKTECLFYEELPNPSLLPSQEALSANEIAALMAELLAEQLINLKHPVIDYVDKCYESMINILSCDIVHDIRV